MVPIKYKLLGMLKVFFEYGSMTDKASRREVARGKLGVVFVDPVHKKVALLPERFKERLAAA